MYKIFGRTGAHQLVVYSTVFLLCIGEGVVASAASPTTPGNPLDQLQAEITSLQSQVTTLQSQVTTLQSQLPVGATANFLGVATILSSQPFTDPTFKEVPCSFGNPGCLAVNPSPQTTNSLIFQPGILTSPSLPVNPLFPPGFVTVTMNLDESKGETLAKDTTHSGVLNLSVVQGVLSGSLVDSKTFDTFTFTGFQLAPTPGAAAAAGLTVPAAPLATAGARGLAIPIGTAVHAGHAVPKALPVSIQGDVIFCALTGSGPGGALFAGSVLYVQSLGKAFINFLFQDPINVRSPTVAIAVRG